MPSSYTTTELLTYLSNWHCDNLRPTAIAALNQALALGNNTPMNWSYSPNEKQWTPNPNFVSFRFPPTKYYFHVWLYTRGEIQQKDSLIFRGRRQTYQSVRIVSPANLTDLSLYIERAYQIKTSR